jgi:16S rRNA (uracil1498-N3)-methyltransferase
VPLSEAFEAFTASGALKLCLEPEAETALGALLATRGERPLLLLVGPEGGFTEAELDAAKRAGFVRARLGQLVLRAELAAVAALSAVVAHSSMQKPETQ